MRYFSQNSQNSKGSALLEFAVIFPVIFFTGIMAFELMNYIRFTSDAGMISREISNAVGRSCAPNVFDTIPLDGSGIANFCSPDDTEALFGPEHLERTTFPCDGRYFDGDIARRDDCPQYFAAYDRCQAV